MQPAVRQIVAPVLEGLDRELGTGFSAVLFGSGARGEFLEGVSDVNLLVVCDSLDFGSLRRLGTILMGLRHRRQPPPLLIERGEWARAADSFPIEVTDMQVARETLRGADPVAGMRVDPAELRHSIERELRGKLLRLRQAYAVHAAEPRALEDVATISVASVAALFRVSLVLHGREAPADTVACLAAAGTVMRVDTAPVARLWEWRRRREPTCPPELFEGYLAAVAAAVRVIDQFTRGGQ